LGAVGLDTLGTLFALGDDFFFSDEIFSLLVFFSDAIFVCAFLLAIISSIFLNSIN
jgi:hypothetical protein